jgi:Fe-S cluster assembly protein SufD
MNAPESVARYCADFERLAPALPGSGIEWVNRVRRAALERFAALGFPTPRNEQWKYTSTAPIEKHAFEPVAGPGPAIAPAQLDAIPFRDLPAHRLLFVNGIYSHALSERTPLPAGVEVCNLGKILTVQPDWLEPALSDGARFKDVFESSAFAALNGAFMADGAVIRLRAGAVIEEPICLVFITTQEETAAHIRNLIIAGEGAQATVIEQHTALDGLEYLTNCVTQIIAGENASIEHYKLQQESVKAFHVAGVHAAQSRDSRFTSHSIALGARLARADISTRFEGEGCECTLNGLYVVGGRQHVDHHTRIDHAYPHGVSREYYRGVLDGAARGVFNGKVVVHPKAQHTDAHQSNHNLLLSKDAEVDTKPELEIYADDVKCSHGATVGQLDDTMIFYLRSRGVSKDVAKGLLTYAFAHEVIGRMKFAALRTRLEQTLIQRLPEGSRIREFV